MTWSATLARSAFTAASLLSLLTANDTARYKQWPSGRICSVRRLSESISAAMAASSFYEEEGLKKLVLHFDTQKKTQMCEKKVCFNIFTLSSFFARLLFLDAYLSCTLSLPRQGPALQTFGHVRAPLQASSPDMQRGRN